MMYYLATFAVGLLSAYLFFKIKRGSFEKIATEILERAEKDAQIKQTELQLVLKQKEFDHHQHLETIREKKTEQLSLREEKLDSQLAFVEKKIAEIEKREKELLKAQERLEKEKKELEETKKTYDKEIETLAGLTPQSAKEQLFAQLSEEMELDISKNLMRRKEEMAQEAEKYAAKILATAINRLSLSMVSDLAVTTVSLPNQEMKGRVIGREGRNIHALEQATGVNFVIDDTPNTVVLSAFDPVRKEIAKIALKELIQDGRIHPTRIEEVVLKTKERVERELTTYGEEAAIQCGICSLHPELIQLLGKLHFRFSYGQNVLEHSIEVSYLMGMIASELKLDAELAKRIGLLHDIGKALSHEQEGSHALIGQEVALRCGEREEVANGIGCHHDEIAPQTIEGSLCSAADKISGGRPGARIEALEYYLKRSKKLEFMAQEFEGVEKAYAMQAGREIRVIVEPDLYDDTKALHLARTIAKKIENELSYPGRIKVTVIREKRAVDYAT